MPEYDKHYELIEALAQEPRLIEPPELYNFDINRVYASIMDRLAQPLTSGEESPFSARTPGSAHSIFVGNVAHMQELMAHQMNLTPDATWMQFFRFIGIELSPAEYPIINLRFWRSPEALRDGLSAEIPIATEVSSYLDYSFKALTLYTTRIEGENEYVDVPARLNRLGTIQNIRIGEFSDLPRLLSFVERVENDGRIISVGREAETAQSAMLRGREWIRTADRCVTAGDYFFHAKQLGAETVNIVHGQQPGVEGFFRDLWTIAVYPPALSTLIEPKLREMSLADERLLVYPGDVIPIDGVIQLRAVPNLSDFDVRNLVATAVVQSINPPAGIWGDRNFARNLAVALENSQGIYAVNAVELKHAITGEKLEEIEILPWHLLEIQSSVDIQIRR